MVDQQAEPVWFKPVDPNPGISSQWGTNFKPWEYRGKAVLAWWEGHVNHNGLGVLLYRQGQLPAAISRHVNKMNRFVIGVGERPAIRRK